VTSIVVVLPKLEDGKAVRNLLVRNGYQVNGVCASGAQALGMLDNLEEGIVICGYKLTDMLYSQLHECMPYGFEMLLMASTHLLTECEGNDIMCLAMPLKVHDLLNTVELMSNTIAYRKRKRKSQPRERKPEERALINEAKSLLMSRNNMTEEEAHRYIQKCSMDSSTNLVETAQMVLMMSCSL
jgi:response regulator NasT